MNENRKPSIVPAVVFIVLALIVFVILIMLAGSIFSMRYDAALSSEADQAVGTALGLVLVLPFTLLALGIESLFSILSLSFSVRLIRLGEGKRRTQGIVLIAIAGACLLLSVLLFVGAVYYPVESLLPA